MTDHTPTPTLGPPETVEATLSPGSSANGAAPAPDSSSIPPRTRQLCSIIIPVHNKASLTRQCLNVLLGQQDHRFDREIIVVDDGSLDLTPRLLAAYGDRVRVITHSPGQGFAAACNAGAAAAAGDYLILLNNDTIPRGGWLWSLVRYAEDHPRAAVIGAKLLFPNDTIQHAGVVFGLDQFPHHIYAGFPANHGAVNKSRRFQVVTAACCLIRRDPWQKMGGFDTGYLNGWEDVDLCLRLGEVGHEVHYCHDSIVYHLESTSRDVRAAQERANRERFVERWQSRITPDDFNYYIEDGLLTANYNARYPIELSASPWLASLTAGDAERAADRILAERARQVAILLRNNIVLNLRVQEAEMRTQEAERQLAAVTTGARPSEPSAGPSMPVAPVATTPSADTAPATSNQPTSYPIVGTVERPARQGEVVAEDLMIVSGWALSKAGIWRVQTFVDGVELGEITYGDPRMDVIALHPGYPDGEKCGFSGVVPMTGLTDGEHGFVLRIIAKDGRQAELATSFSYDSTARISGRILAKLDRPSPHSRTVVRDRLSIVGWALSPYGIRGVETLIDDEARGHATYGTLRPDVALSFANYPNADHSGFAGSAPLDGLADGEHELILRITAFDERQFDLQAHFEIDSTAIAIGEVPHINIQYPTWLRQHLPSAEQLAMLREEADQLTHKPVLSLIVAIGATPPSAIASLLATVRDQVYDTWELCLALSPATPEATRAFLGQRAADDNRVKIVDVADDELAVAATAAFAIATGELVSVISPNLSLSPLALFAIARTLNETPDIDLIYADEDKLDPTTGQRWDPFFKPDWSPDLLLAMDYLGPFTFYRRALVERAGGIRSGFAGAEHFDLSLRITETTTRVRHVAELLSSRLTNTGAGDDQDETAVTASYRALGVALARRSIGATVEHGIRPGRWRVHYHAQEFPSVAIVLPTGGKLTYLQPCLDDLLNKTTYPNLELLIVDNSAGAEVAALCDELATTHSNLRRAPFELKPFNFSAIINHAVPLTTADYVLLLNDDITVITPDWIETMMEHIMRPEIGVVGPKLLYADGTIQHAGVILGPYEGTGHAFKQYSGNHTGYFGLPNVIRNYSAVTFACALMRRAIFDEIGGLDAEHLPIAFNDVDFCLRVGEAGYRIVYTPHAVLCHHESVTKTVIAAPSEIAHLRDRWGHVIAHDPFYNRNLTRRAEDCSLNLDESHGS